MTNDKMKDFQQLTKPLIKWLNDNHHPHVTLIITPTSAELLEGILAFPTTEFIKD